jgi:hypothetical protein
VGCRCRRQCVARCRTAFVLKRFRFASHWRQDQASLSSLANPKTEVACGPASSAPRRRLCDVCERDQSPPQSRRCAGIPNCGNICALNRECSASSSPAGPAESRPAVLGRCSPAGRPRRASAPSRARRRVHDYADLRHSFAVATLLDWYRDGADVTAQMPLLSAGSAEAQLASTPTPAPRPGCVALTAPWQ